MPGPAPTRNPRRTNARPDWRQLPSDGFDGDVPVWPIGDPTVAQSVLWLDLWRTPQADGWADLGWTRVVARYAVLVLAGEEPYAPVSLFGEIRQMEDRLGLNPMAMRRLFWEIEQDSADVTEDEADNVVELFG